MHFGFDLFEEELWEKFFCWILNYRIRVTFQHFAANLKDEQRFLVLTQVFSPSICPKIVCVTIPLR